MRILCCVVAAVAAFASAGSADAGWWHGYRGYAYYGPGYFDAPRPFLYSPTFYVAPRPVVYAAPVSYSYYAPTVVYGAPIAVAPAPVVAPVYYPAPIVSSYYGVGYGPAFGAYRTSYRVGPHFAHYRVRGVAF